MKTKHTPGPWRTVIGGETIAVTTSNEAPKQAGICRILNKSVAYEAGEGEANAALIAAAPDMLAALESFASSYHAWIKSRPGAEGLMDAAMNAAHAAICKAEGAE